MKTIKIQLIISLFISVLMFFNSCVPTYVPNVVNTPLLSNKGEFQMAVHTGVSGNDPQFAYAETDNIGVMHNGSFANRKENSDK